MAMRFERYSAIPIFGAPLEGDFGDPKTSTVVDLMRAYGVEAEEVPAEATDITPYYWKRPEFRYYASLAHPEGPIVVEMLPVNGDSENYLLGKTATAGVGFVIEGVRRIEVPTDTDAVIIGGPSPRYQDRICVHELITVSEDA